MKLILIFLLVINHCISFSQREGVLVLDTSAMDFEYNSIGRDNLDFKKLVMYSDSLEAVNNQETIGFQLDTISCSEYNELKSVFRSKLDRDTSLVKWTDSSFIITSGNSDIHFKADKRDYSNFEYYIGYLSTLQLYAISSIESSQEIGYLKLVDKVSGSFFYMESPSDYPMDSLEVSAENKFLSSYVNDLYIDRAFVSLFEIDQESGKYRLKEAGGIYFLKARIIDLIWVTENEFSVYLKELNQDGSPFKELYLKVKIG